ncbi:hypothetical protein FRC17_007693 [Serendipita sp. 399]|nr:hypothetical protein FRC17_007693 [Serendipita sp. 399]
MSTFECQIALDPDIAGIGIRLSLYILSLSGPIIAISDSFTDELSSSVEKSLGVTGLALLLTAFITASQRNLDLFHALCIFHLVGLTGFSISPSLRKHKPNRINHFVTFGLFYLGLVGFCIFMIYLFAIAPRIGPVPECNAQIVYVIFGIDVAAINYEFRWLFIAYIIVSVICVLLGGIVRFKADEETQTKRGRINYLGDLAGRAYIIATLELIIRRNHVLTDGSSWSFGQILSMTMLIGPCIELISQITYWASSGEKPNKEEAKQRDYDDSPEALGKIAGRILLSILDLGFNAAAGAAAAATGAHVNGSPTTTQVLRLGALAGVIKSGVFNYSFLISSMSSGSTAFVMMLTGSTFGIAFIVTNAIAQRVLHAVPDSLLIAALATAAPLTVGGAVSLVGDNFQPPFWVVFIFSDTKSIWAEESFEEIKEFVLLFSQIIGDPAFNALAGYTFARVAHNHGFDLCKYNAGAAAGAVYGFLIWICNLIVQGCLGIEDDD